MGSWSNGEAPSPFPDSQEKAKSDGAERKRALRLTQAIARPEIDSAEDLTASDRSNIQR